MTHCWHPSRFQHLMIGHRDVDCCWCNEHRCQQAVAEPLAGHGPHAQRVYSGWTNDDGECAARAEGATPVSGAIEGASDGVRKSG